jgi:hypothetical protein
MRRRTVRSAFAAMAISAAAVGTPAVAGAVPTGPCEEVTYVGVCEPFHEQPRSPSQQSMGEVIVPGVGNNPVAVG